MLFLIINISLISMGIVFLVYGILKTKKIITLLKNNQNKISWQALFYFMLFFLMSYFVVIAMIMLNLENQLLIMLGSVFCFGGLFVAIVSFLSASTLRKLNESVDQLKQLQVATERFVPWQFVKLINKKNIKEVVLGDHVVKNFSILFSDIRNFTSISEQMNLGENFKFVNSYFQKMAPSVRKYHGFIDKYIGDSIMALFPKSPKDALHTAIDFFHQLESYNHDRSKTGLANINIGVGINTGELTIGTVGEAQRLETTVISDSVNIASRTENLTKLLNARTLVTKATVDQMKVSNTTTSEKKEPVLNNRPFSFRRVGAYYVKGKKEKIEFFELLDCYLKQQDKYLQTINLFQEGVNWVEKKHKKNAQKCFESVLKINKSDKVAKYYLVFCTK